MLYVLRRRSFITLCRAKSFRGEAPSGPRRFLRSVRQETGRPEKLPEVPCAGWPARPARLSAFAHSTGAGLPGRLQASGTRQIVSIRWSWYHTVETELVHTPKAACRLAADGPLSSCKFSGMPVRNGHSVMTALSIQAALSWNVMRWVRRSSVTGSLLSPA